MDCKDIEWTVEAHTNFATKPSKAFRKWDGKTPYHTHPIWCAATILTETSLDEDLRKDGSLALLYHDVLEDTRKGLPEWLSDRVVSLVKDMTFASNAEEMELVWGKSRVIKLLKLYDKVSNLLDGAWMDAEKRTRYNRYTSQLCDDVEQNFGSLNIVRMARAITTSR